MNQIKELAERITLEMTCSACPEQYDATLDGALVGYLRLRHGYFRVDYPECGERTILEGYPKGDGVFEDDERDEWLSKAKFAIANAILGSSGKEKIMQKDFHEALDDLIDQYVADVADRGEVIDEIMSALEMKLMALREEQADE